MLNDFTPRMDNVRFEEKYGISKPARADPVIFFCRKGIRAKEGSDFIRYVKLMPGQYNFVVEEVLTFLIAVNTKLFDFSDGACNTQTRRPTVES